MFSHPIIGNGDPGEPATRRMNDEPNRPNEGCPATNVQTERAGSIGSLCKTASLAIPPSLPKRYLVPPLTYRKPTHTAAAGPAIVPARAAPLSTQIVSLLSTPTHLLPFAVASVCRSTYRSTSETIKSPSLWLPVPCAPWFRTPPLTRPRRTAYGPPAHRMQVARPHARSQHQHQGGPPCWTTKM